MRSFTQLSAIAAALPIDNVDTDQIIPARFLKTVSRSGLGKGLFAALRADPGFVLNQPPWNEAGILIAGDNFGCGSSREHAAWALLDFGVRCIIAPRFADIFSTNCCKNGMLTLELPTEIIGKLTDLARHPATAMLTVDLESQLISGSQLRIPFQIEPARKDNLVRGIDEIARSLQYLDADEGASPSADKGRSWVCPISQTALDRSLGISQVSVRQSAEGIE